jgi:hypothetical protein
MQLDRNITNPKRGKYALIKLREATVKRVPIEFVDNPPLVMVEESAVDFGDTADSDFFVIRLKDKYAAPALRAYAQAAIDDDPEYAAEIFELAVSAENHPSKKMPD